MFPRALGVLLAVLCVDGSSAAASDQSTYRDFASLAAPVTILGKPTTFQGAERRLYTLDFREIVSLNREPQAPEAPPAARMDSNSDTLGSIDIVSIAGAVK